MTAEAKGAAKVLTMRPIVILPIGGMSKADIQILRDNGLCVVEAKNPGMVRFMDPPPVNYTDRQRAAIALSRTLLTDGVTLNGTKYRNHFAQMYADILMEDDPLQQVPHVSATEVKP